MDSWTSLAHDSDSAPVVVAGDPDESLLIQAVQGIAGLQMPPENPLPEQDVQTLVRWVRSGAF